MTVGQRNNLFRLAPLENPALRLFCLPYAGGSAAAYRLWQNELADGVEVVSLHLPGRGHRMRETPLRTIEEIVDTAYEEFAPYCDTPTALFGHSMGAIIAYELAQRLSSEGHPPVHVFLSARAKERREDQPVLHKMSDAEFLEQVDRRYNGVPAALRNDPDMLELVLPALRADIEAFETYQARTQPPLDCPLTIYGGDRDPNVSREELETWRGESSAYCRVRMFSGDHFFLDPQRAFILNDISATLTPHLGELARGRSIL